MTRELTVQDSLAPVLVAALNAIQKLHVAKRLRAATDPA